MNVVAIRCHWCSRELPSHRVHRLASNQVICDHCLEWNFHALDFLGGAMPKGCQVCGQSWENLCAMEPGQSNVRMYVVPKDGILQLLCKGCAQPYVQKRADLYRGTQFEKDGLIL